MAEAERYAPAGRRVLVIAEDEERRNALSARVIGAGHDVMALRSASPLGREVRRWKPHLVVADEGQSVEVRRLSTRATAPPALLLVGEGRGAAPQGGAPREERAPGDAAAADEFDAALARALGAWEPSRRRRRHPLILCGIAVALLGAELLVALAVSDDDGGPSDRADVPAAVRARDADALPPPRVATAASPVTGAARWSAAATDVRNGGIAVTGARVRPAGRGAVLEFRVARPALVVSQSFGDDGRRLGRPQVTSVPAGVVRQTLRDTQADRARRIVVTLAATAGGPPTVATIVTSAAPGSS